jgi:hypothetical protein
MSCELLNEEIELVNMIVLTFETLKKISSENCPKRSHINKFNWTIYSNLF